MTADDINELVKDITSFDMRPEDTEVYLKYIAPLPKGSVVVDFGTGQAKSVLRMALSAPQVEIWTWDWGHGNPETHPVPYFKMITDRLRKYNVSNVYFIVADSDKAWPEWDKPIDVLNIDASHLYEETLKDLQRWEPFVRSGGYIFIHDYEYKINDPREHEKEVPSYKFEGMRKAVQEHCPLDKFEFLEYHGGTQVIRKL